MCSCQSKISGMKFNSKSLISSLVDGALGVGGAVLGQEVGRMVPATVDSTIVDAGKIVLGCLAPAFIKGKSQNFVRSIGIGLAAQGGLNLVNAFVLKPTGYTRIGGADNRAYALAGADNRAYALRGGSVPSTKSTYAGGAGV